jgi:hypothetical protein
MGSRLGKSIAKTLKSAPPEATFKKLDIDNLATADLLAGRGFRREHATNMGGF